VTDNELQFRDAAYAGNAPEGTIRHVAFRPRPSNFMIMAKTGRLRRVSRRGINLLVLAGGVATSWQLVRYSPILLGASAVGLLTTVWWFRRREFKALGYLRGRYLARDLLLAGTLVAGLWVGIYLVFSLGDIGFAAATTTTVPIGSDAASLTIGEVLRAGLLSTIAAMALLFPFRSTQLRSKRDPRNRSVSAAERDTRTPIRGVELGE